MIKVVPFSQTSGSENFKTFLALPFSIDMLYPVFGDKSCEQLFEGWHGKDMINWHKFTNEDKVVLEFYATYYIVTKNVPNAIKYMLSIPKTIDDFINDINRFEIQLYWTPWIDLNYEPKDYLHVDEIKGYYKDLLIKLGKSHELQ
jgi:hypothetical protein